MAIQIHIEAIKGLRNMKNPSFLIIEIANGAIVDFDETREEVLRKCMIADSQGCKCKFYETSVNTIEQIKNATKNVDVNHAKKGVLIEGFDAGIFPP